MSRSNDAGHFFQTSDALATSERKQAKAKNKYGDPIKLPSKILAAQAFPRTSNSIIVAEAAGEVKRVDLENKKLTRLFSESTAPLTCLATDSTGSIFAGSWDKTIYHIPSDHPQQPIRKFTGHTDFVKCLLWTPLLLNKPVLLSGGADATIILWDISTGKPLHKLKGHTKALQNLAIDPLSIGEGDGSSFVLYSASSDREIRKWRISPATAYEITDEPPILAHETSVYALRFDSSGDLWTASADKTAKHLVRSRNWEADTVLPHPDFVRDVVVFEHLGVVVTACRDEEVRVWDAASEECVCVFSGHFEEVTALVADERASRVVSVSIDGTVRRWGLEKGQMTKYLEEVERDRKGESVDEKKDGGNLLTAEEEAELAELMDDDD